MKFRKKPVVIEATQWFKHGDHPKVTIMPRGRESANKGWIHTLEGGHEVTTGDWIITGIAGEHYPCKPDIFEATYEPVDTVVERKSLTECPHGLVDICCSNPSDCTMDIKND